MRLWVHEKNVAGLDYSQSQSIPNRRCRSTPTAKRRPNIRHLALGLMVFIDRVAAKAKPEPINARHATRSRLETSVRSFSTSATTLPLPLYRLTSLQVCACAAKLLFVWGKGLMFFGRLPFRFIANNKTTQQATGRPCSSGWDRGQPPPLV